MGLVSEFKEFIMQGNAVDLAVGVVIGAAFGKIVASLVGDVIMPVVGYFSAGVDFSGIGYTCLLYTSPSPRDRTRSRMPSSA